MTGKKRFNKAINKLNDVKQDVIKYIPGWLGLSSQIVTVPSRPGFVYIRVRDNINEILQAYNDTVPVIYNLPVIIARDRINKNRYYVVGRDTGKYTDWGMSTYTPDHGWKHSFGVGNDVVWVYSQQFMPHLVYPSGSGADYALFSPQSYLNASGNWYNSGLQTITGLVSAKPLDNTARILLAYIDGNDTIKIATGSSIATNLTGTSSILGALPSMPSATAEPIAAIRLVSGTSAITWSNLYDLRQFHSRIGSGGGGTGSSGGGHTIQDDGSSLPQRSKLNFVGSGFVTWDIGGSDTTVISGTASVGPQGPQGPAGATGPTGSAGATGPQGPAGVGTSQIPIYDDNTFKVTGTNVHFGANLSVAVTGTSAWVDGTSNDANAIHTNATGEISGISYEKTSLIGDDLIIIEDAGYTYHKAKVKVSNLPGSTGSSMGGHVIQSDGLSLNQRQKLNFLGGIVAYDDVGNNTTIVSGTSSGATGPTGPSGPPGSNTLLLYDDNVFKVTGTAIHFNTNLSVIISGTSTWIDAAGSTGSSQSSGNTVFIYDDNVFSSTGTAIHFNNNLTVITTGSSVWVNASITTTGSSAAIYNAWDADAPPTSPSAYDDEFNDSSLDGKWIETDRHNKLTVTENNYGVNLAHSSNSGDAICGIVQPIPAGQFTIAAKMAISTPYDKYVYFGMMLTDTISGTADVAKCQVFQLATTPDDFRVGVYYFSDQDNYSSTVAEKYIQAHPFWIYLRIRRDATPNYYFDWSYDGESWLQYYVGTLGFTPTRMGLYINNTNSTVYVPVARYKFFRYKNSCLGISDPIEGRVIPIGTG